MTERRKRTPADRAQERLDRADRVLDKVSARLEKAEAEYAAARAEREAAIKRFNHARQDPDLPDGPHYEPEDEATA